MKDIEKMRRQAEQEARDELTEQVIAAEKLRARLPRLVDDAVTMERKRITVELADTDLSQREIADAVDMSHAWVSQTIREHEVGNE